MLALQAAVSTIRAMFAALKATETLVIAVALVPVLLVSTIAIGRWLKRRHHLHLGPSYLLLCIALSLYIPLIFFGDALMPAKKATAATSSQAAAKNLDAVQERLSALETEIRQTREQLGTGSQPTGNPNRDRLRMHLSAITAVLATFFVMALLRRYFWELWFERRRKTPAPKFLSQISGLVLFLGVVLVVLSTIYKTDLTGFVFGSTIVVGIIGFAMQDLLGNIIAGIALEIGKPFKTGDWLVVDGQHAEVVEVNWRSTRLRNNDDIYLDIPNKNIVGATINNLTHPTRQHALRLRIGFDYGIAPNFVKDCLTRATARAEGVLKAPPPRVFLADFADSAVVYEIKFWLEDESRFSDIVDSIRTNVWYEAQRSKIKIPFPIRTLQIERPSRGGSEAPETVRSVLKRQPILQCLDDSQVTKLLAHASLLKFGRGEAIIEQGRHGDSMFVILSGEADVLISANGSDGKNRVATLRAGDYFGEMSLLTGEPRSATVVAKSDCETWEIQKAVFAEVLEDNKALLERISEALAQRKMEMEGVLAANTERAMIAAKKREYTVGILAKLYSFFEL